MAVASKGSGLTTYTYMNYQEPDVKFPQEGGEDGRERGDVQQTPAMRPGSEEGVQGLEV